MSRIARARILEVRAALDASVLPEFISVDKFARNDLITSGEEVVWEHGGAYSGFLAAAEPLRIQAGGDAADDAAGVGARSVVLIFLDEDWNLVKETLDTNGVLASVNTSRHGLRLWQAYVKTAGVYNTTGLGTAQANTGTVTIEGATSGATLACIPPGLGTSFTSVLTIPAGYVGLIQRTRFDIQGPSTRTADCSIWCREKAHTVSPPTGGMRLIRRFTSVSGNLPVDHEAYTLLPEKSDVWATAKSTGGAVPLAVEFYMDLLLVRND